MRAKSPATLLSMRLAFPIAKPSYGAHMDHIHIGLNRLIGVFLAAHIEETIYRWGRIFIRLFFPNHRIPMGGCLRATQRTYTDYGANTTTWLTCGDTELDRKANHLLDTIPNVWCARHRNRFVNAHTYIDRVYKSRV